LGVQFGSITKVSLAVVLSLVACGCRPGKRSTPTIGEAYVGPAILKIRSDIPLESPGVATVKHGDRLEVLQRRRRFLKVRTPSGIEGWTDERVLLSADDMAALRELAKSAAKMPIQGQAISYSELNVHTQPSRGSPSFLQVKAKEKVDVLTHMVAPRLELPRKPLIPPPPKKAKAETKKAPAKPPKYPPPPMPKPPSPPADWLELSKTDLDEEPASEEPAEAAPIPTEDWSLVRTSSGQSGWVLTRRLSMAIPDEVAQYAEGRRIVSYFSLGKVEDGAVKKDIWLWTTIAGSSQPYDFDSFRVFIWSLKRHRYETAYIDRNLRGYAPVIIKDVDFASSAQRGQVSVAKYPGFSICVQKADGQRYRREYALLTNIVRFAGEHPCEAPAPPPIDLQTMKAPAPAPTAPAPAPQQEAESFSQKLKKRLRALTHGHWGG
jgi:SH3-like domain-containing protein